MIRAALLSLPVAVWTATVAAQAAPEPPLTLEGSSAISITAAGGASLGAYEAGYLHAFVSTLARNPGVARIRQATGTSAGSLNALLALMATCMPVEDDPARTLFYDAWSHTTLDVLDDRREMTSTNLFSRQVMRRFLARLEARWNEGLPESCDVVLGVPVTRSRAYAVSLHGEEQASGSRNEERFVVRIRGRGEGVPPSIENYQDVERGYALALLPVDGDGVDELSSLRELLLASGAFPLVFAPVSLAHCMAGVVPGGPTTCTPDGADSAIFVDGGFFENQPLRLAATIARSSVEYVGPPELHRFREMPDIRLHAIPERTFFLLLDPSSHAFPTEDPREEGAGAGIVETGMELAEHVLSGMSAGEIQTLLETYPEVRERVRPTAVDLPPISALLSNFFGFVDRKLADFDFLLGMRDAEHQLEDELVPVVARDRVERFERAAIAPSSPLRPRADCMRAYLDGEGDPAVLCAGPDLRSFRAMLVVTLERLYSTCAFLEDAGVYTRHPRCLAAMRGEAPPDLLGVRGDRDWHLPPESSSELSREAIERLGDYGFHFEDLGLDADEGSRVLVRLREKLGDLAGAFVGRQPSGRQALDVLVRAALNSLHYAPPRVIAHVVVGVGTELGVSLGAPSSRVPFLRASFALELGGLQTMVGIDRYAFQLAPSVGIELEPTPLSRSSFQLRFGARVGYAFSTRDRFGTESCGSSASEQVLCSRMTVTTYAAVSLLELVRLQLGVTLRPALGDDRRFGWSFGPSLGIQLRSRR